MGCLTAPFKVLGCLGLLAALVVGWLYRDRRVQQGPVVYCAFEGQTGDEAVSVKSAA